MALTQSDLFKIGDADLVELFRSSPPGDIPTGPLAGAGFLRWGDNSLARSFARLVPLVLWRGKLFVPDGYLVNRISAFDVLAVLAQVYRGPSLVDEQDCIVIDYSKLSLVGRWVRDEMREVSPGLYLGVVWLLGTRVAWFSLKVPEVAEATEVKESETA
ncbi:hypothetical protein [Streptomyces sp. CoH27]|uniref:hypothetical protein n=1 Tax=Streptomyces sp. CoH27 TaxID=2875763 RepID=UPI001CD6BD39|nr:hypothetical protein [Streptomyces sp. CoH27]